MTQSFIKIFCSCLLFISYTQHVYTQNRIIGGSYVNISERPFQAAIMTSNDGTLFSFCGGGVIINSRWILTAAHVVGSSTTDKLKVGTGSTNYLQSDYSTVEKIIIHPNYKYNGKSKLNDNDIALIKLAKPLSFGDNRNAIKISNSTYYSANTEATVSGWGMTDENNSSASPLLKKADILISTMSEFFLKSEMTSSGYHSSGDSGGPLTISTGSSDLLIGIVNSTNKAQNLKYYVNVGHYFDWIMSEMYSCSITGPDIINGSGEYTVAANGSFTVKVDGVLQSATVNGNTVTVSSSGNGNGNIYIYIDGYLLASKKIWVGKPIIFGIQEDGNYLRLTKYGADQHISSTSWKIGSNYYTAYDDFIYNPYASSSSSSSGQEINVTVTATNQYGTSNPYTTTIKTSGSGHIGVSRVGNTNAFEIAVDNASSTSSETISYQLISTSQGSVASNGTVDSDGGILDFSDKQKGLYLLKLTTADSDVETFKISVK